MANRRAPIPPTDETWTPLGLTDLYTDEDRLTEEAADEIIEAMASGEIDPDEAGHLIDLAYGDLDEATG